MLQLFQKSKIPLTWKSIIVGRKLGVATNEFIEAFAVEYLIQHPSVHNLDINELAYGIPDTYQGNLDINELLEKIVYSFSLKIPQKETVIWNLESRKWRYFLLKKASLEKNTENELEDAIENIYCKFEHPSELEQFIPHLSQRSSENVNKEEYNKSLLDRLNQFLKKEETEMVKRP